MGTFIFACIFMGGFITYLLMSLIWILGYYADISTEWSESGRERVDSEWRTFNTIYMVLSIGFLSLTIIFFATR